MNLENSDLGVGRIPRDRRPLADRVPWNWDADAQARADCPCAEYLRMRGIRDPVPLLDQTRAKDGEPVELETWKDSPLEDQDENPGVDLSAELDAGGILVMDTAGGVEWRIRLTAPA